MQQSPNKNPGAPDDSNTDQASEGSNIGNEINGAASAPGPLQVLQSVLAAFFGVQSDRNRERDFTGGRATPFIVAGLVVTLVFIAVVWTVVRLVLASATGA